MPQSVSKERTELLVAVGALAVIAIVLPALAPVKPATDRVAVTAA